MRAPAAILNEIGASGGRADLPCARCPRVRTLRLTVHGPGDDRRDPPKFLLKLSLPVRGMDMSFPLSANADSTT